jgi:hypothetical protein
MTRLGPIVRNNGGDLVRMLGALNGFKATHGSWPTELPISRITFSNLKEHRLTELGFTLLENKLAAPRRGRAAAARRAGA